MVNWGSDFGTIPWPRRPSFLPSFLPGGGRFGLRDDRAGQSRRGPRETKSWAKSELGLGRLQVIEIAQNRQRNPWKGLHEKAFDLVGFGEKLGKAWRGPVGMGARMSFLFVFNRPLRHARA